MEMTLADQYYLKAANSYPWQIADALENLNYALSYDDDHAQAWCLNGIVHMYNLKDYGEAENSYNNALRSDMGYVDTYKHLILLMIWKGELARADKIIDYAFKVVAMDKSTILAMKAMTMEVQGRYADAEGILNSARLISLNCATVDWLDTIADRIKTKKKLRKKMAQKSQRRKSVRKA